MAIDLAEIDAAPQVTPEQIMAALKSETSVIRTNDEAMKVADSIGAKVFKVGHTIFVPFDTKIN